MLSAKQCYLENIPLSEAEQLFFDKLEALGALEPNRSEEIAANESLGRVTAEPVYARISSPHYHAAAMDGIALRAADTFGASETTPLQLRLNSQAFVVDTGDPLPEGCNAVVMIEEVHFPETGVAELTAAAVPWQHVRLVGEDFVKTEMVLTARQQIRPYDIGGLLAAGVNRLQVYPRPRVAIIPTGTEIVPPGGELKPGDIIEFNSHILSAQVRRWGGEPIVAPITPDDYQLLKRRILEWLERADLLAVIAGSSHGREDYTAQLVEELGELFVHGVAIKPGKPVILGAIKGKPVIGVPGYPVSAVLAGDLFAKRIIYRRQGLPVPERERKTAYVSKKIVSALGAEEFIRVRLGQVGDKLVVQSLSRGAGAVTSLVQADAILRVPRLSEGYTAGSRVAVELLRAWEQIARTTVVVGSHDLTLDLIADQIRRHHPDQRLISSHVGSLGGIMALLRGEAHLAGIHLLDPASGVYNLPDLRRLMKGRHAHLVNLSYRTQGFMIRKGNPAGIKQLADLTKPGVEFVNRQRGSGTRVLLDYLLGKEGIDPGQISGYQREEYTHMGVAVAVASGNATVGLGIRAAADALGLDFIPVGEERYDLCIPDQFWGSREIKIVLEVITSKEFKQEASALAGYDFRDCGRVMGQV